MLGLELEFSYRLRILLLFRMTQLFTRGISVLGRSLRDIGWVQALGLSRRTTDRDITYALAWLKREMRRTGFGAATELVPVGHP